MRYARSIVLILTCSLTAAVFIPFNTSHAEDPIISATKEKCNRYGKGGGISSGSDPNGGSSYSQCLEWSYSCPSGSTPVEGDNKKCRKDTIHSTQTCVKKHYVSGSSSGGYPASGGGHEECSEYKYDCPSGYKLVEGDNSKCKYQSSSKPSKPTSPFAGDKKSTVSPTVAKCSKAANHKKGDSKGGFYCYDGNEYYAINFKCSTSSAMQEAVKDGITWRRCVSAGDGVYTAAGQEMLKQAPGLAEITSDPKVIGQCAVQAKDSVEMEKSRHSVPDEAARRQEIFAQCLAGKTGKSVDEVKAALGGVDPLVGATKGAEVTAATEQQLAQEQPAEGEEEKPKEECGGHVEGIGYFLCPILERLVDFADGTWGLFEYLLQTNPLPDDTSKPLPSAWSGLRDVANAILAIIFLAIIISQVSNIGISNYGVKKMLPRLIIAAIAINMSYFLMQIITDIANILGSTLYDFISELAPKVQYRDVGWATIITDIAATGIAVAAIGAGATAAGHAMSDMDPKVGLLLLFVFIVPAILGLIAGLMALVFRAGIIPVLAISAPIAFAAWVLPNTQKLFEKWKSTFLGMIFLYPLASLYCGGLKFVALSLMSENTEPQQVLFRMMGVTMLLLGSGFVAVLAIKSNSIMGGMMNGIKNIGTKLTAPAVNSLSSYAGALKGAKRAEFLAKDHSKAAEAAERNKYHRLDPRRLRARVKHATGRRMQAHDERMAQAKMQAKVYESAVEQEEKRKYEAKVAENPALLGRVAETVGGKAFIRDAAYKAANMELSSKYSGNAVAALNDSSNEYVKALAVKEIAERGGAGEIAQVREYLENGGTIDNTDMAEALQKMKKRDAGVAEVGEKAMDRLKQSGGAPVSFNKNEIAQLTKEGFAGVGGDVQAAEQNAAAIQGSDMSWQQAERILGDRHVMRTTPEKNVTAIEAKFEVGLAEDIKNNKISQDQAMKIVTNERIVEHISSGDLKDKLLDIATRPAGQASGIQQSGGAQPAASSGSTRQEHSAGNTTQRPPVTLSSPHGRT